MNLKILQEIFHGVHFFVYKIGEKKKEEKKTIQQQSISELWIKSQTKKTQKSQIDYFSINKRQLWEAKV